MGKGREGMKAGNLGESGKVRPEKNRGCQASSWKPRRHSVLHGTSQVAQDCQGLSLGTPC